MKLNTISGRFIITGTIITSVFYFSSCKHNPILPDVSNTTQQQQNQAGDSSATSVDGAYLYTQNCAGCHGPIATSAKLGVTSSAIQTGITSVTAMKNLSWLSAAQVQAIADALKISSSQPAVTDGATLYANNCASCHGPLATSAKIGATVSRIQNAISTVTDMKTLSSLTSTQVQAISDALLAQPMPTDGPSLYAINCASCHGPLASSQVGSSSVSRIQSAISEKSAMHYLSFLTYQQIQAISGALAGIPGGDD